MRCSSSCCRCSSRALGRLRMTRSMLEWQRRCSICSAGTGSSFPPSPRSLYPVSILCRYGRWRWQTSTEDRSGSPRVKPKASRIPESKHLDLTVADLLSDAEGREDARQDIVWGCCAGERIERSQRGVKVHEDQL